MAVEIAALGTHIPEKRLSNEEFSALVDTSDEWIRSHTGIGARHIAADGMLTSDMAADAARKALAAAGLDARDLDLIVLGTATPDYFGFPATAGIVGDKIGARGCPAFDLTAGCTGFIYSLDIAASWLEAHGARHALVIGAEALSRIVDWKDRSTCVLFGDGAGAAILSRREDRPGGIIKTILGADGSKARELYLIQAERDKSFERAQALVPSISMNGQAVYYFAVHTITELVKRMLKETSLSLDDFRWIVPHQANARIVQTAAKRLGIAEDRFFMNIEEYANTSSASVPIALLEMSEKKLLAKGDLVMLIAFGAGLSYGAAAVRW